MRCLAVFQAWSDSRKEGVPVPESRAGPIHSHCGIVRRQSNGRQAPPCPNMVHWFPFQRFPRIEFEQFSCFTSQPSFRRARVIQLVRKQFPDIRRQAGLPSAHFARTGPKSTNQSLNIALAAASRVSFMRRLISILSSSVPRTCAIVRCSRSGAVQFPAARHQTASSKVHGRDVFRSSMQIINYMVLRRKSVDEPRACNRGSTANDSKGR